MKFKNYIKNFLKYTFFLNLGDLNNKSFYLIIGTQNKNNLNKILVRKNKKYYLDISKKKINLAYFLNVLYWYDFFKVFLEDNFTTAYYFIIIKNLKCKSVITFYDNNINFYKLKKHLPSIKFFSIQNGARHLFNDIFGLEELKEQKNLKADFIFVFNKDIKKMYEKYIDAKVVVIGSFKNNLVPKFFKNKRSNLAYISQYRESIILKKQIFYWKKKKITSEDFYKNDKILLNNIFKFCKKNKIKLNIICATKDKSEKKYFQTLINNKNINFIEKKYNDLGVYKSIHLFSIIVCSWSTLGYECLSRDIKTCFFRQKMKNLSDRSFGWPNNSLPKETFFYTEEPDHKKIYKILNKIYKMSKDEWIKKIHYYKTKVMFYDYKNKIIKKYINNV